MITFEAPSGASDAFRHAVQLVNRDLEGLLDELNNHQQFQFWSNLHQYALALAEGKRERPHLIASAERVDSAAREALEMADEKLSEHLDPLSATDRGRFWTMIHEYAEQQTEMTGHTKIRHGGGKR